MKHWFKNLIFNTLHLSASKGGSNYGCGNVPDPLVTQGNLGKVCFLIHSIFASTRKLNYFLLIAFLFFGCENFPKDPENTLEKVKEGILRVGYSENPPWVVKTDSVPIGIEAELIKAFAKTLHAKVEWKNDTEQNLFEELENKNLDLVIAGVTKDTPWKKKAGLTRPFAIRDNKKHVMAVRRGENAFIVHLERFLYRQEGEVKARMRP